MRLIAALLLAAAAPALPASAQTATAAATAEDARFASFSERFVDEYLRRSPVWATQLGDHRHDARLRDVSAAGQASDRAFAEKTLAELRGFDASKLSRANQVDRIVLEDQLRYAIFAHDDLKDWAWDPLGYAYETGTGLFGLTAREFAPLPDRLRSATGRLEALPAYLAGARAALDPARVPKIHAETAAKQNAGLSGLIDGILAQKAALPAPEQARLEKAVASAKAAVAEHQAWLDKTLVPNARGNERIGAALYDRKLALALNSPLSRAEIGRRAEATIDEVRAEMYRISADMLKGRPGAPPAPAKPGPAEQQAVIEAGLALAYADAPAREEVLPFARQTLDQATAFAKAKDLISFPSAQFEIIEMPEYARGVAVAYADMPGPLEADQRGFYAVMPIPAEWTPEQAASFLREYNKWGIHVLTIHEAMPGHLLQLAHSNGYKSRLRSVLQSGPMVEGWALYGEDVMVEAGYLDRDPRYLLAQHKFRLRSALNAILDQRFHVEGLTREEAMTLMTRTAFQEEREAAGKWTRMQLSSAQLPVYFVGWQEWRDLRAAAEKRPGFKLKSFHDEALSYGSPPVRFIRQQMLGEAIR